MHDNLSVFIRAHPNIIEIQGMGQHTGGHHYQSVIVSQKRRIQMSIKIPGRLYGNGRREEAQKCTIHSTKLLAGPVKQKG